MNDPVLSDDPVLDALDREEAAPIPAELAALLGRGYVWEVAGELLPVPMPAAGVFALLTSLDSPLLWPVGRGREVTDDDLRVAGMLALGRKDSSVSTPESARLAAAEFWGDAVPPRADLDTMIADAFGPYRRMPPDKRKGDGGEPLRADGPFLAGLVARVHAATGLLPRAILWELPMAAAALYDLEYCRWNLHMTINRNQPPSADLLRRKAERYRELLPKTRRGKS